MYITYIILLFITVLYQFFVIEPSINCKEELKQW